MSLDGSAQLSFWMWIRHHQYAMSFQSVFELLQLIAFRRPGNIETIRDSIDGTIRWLDTNVYFAHSSRHGFWMVPRQLCRW